MGPSSTTPAPSLHGLAGEQCVPVELVELPEHGGLVRTLDGKVLLMLRPDGVWADPRTGEGMFGREACEEYDRVAPDAARRFREEMSFGPDWCPVPSARRFDQERADEAFLEMTAHREPGKTREERMERLRAKRAAVTAEVRRAPPREERQVGVLRQPRDGTLFGREACAWMDRVAPDAARRFRATMLLGPDWSALPGDDLATFDERAVDQAFAELMAQVLPHRERRAS